MSGKDNWLFIKEVEWKSRREWMTVRECAMKSSMHRRQKEVFYESCQNKTKRVSAAARNILKYYVNFNKFWF